MKNILNILTFLVSTRFRHFEVESERKRGFRTMDKEKERKEMHYRTGGGELPPRKSMHRARRFCLPARSLRSFSFPLIIPPQLFPSSLPSPLPPNYPSLFLLNRKALVNRNSFSCKFVTCFFDYFSVILAFLGGQNVR